MAETFREFFERRNGIAFPGLPREMLHHVMARLANTMADWADELAKRAPEPTAQRLLTQEEMKLFKRPAISD